MDVLAKAIAFLRKVSLPRCRLASHSGQGGFRSRHGASLQQALPFCCIFVVKKESSREVLAESELDNVPHLNRGKH